MIRWKFFFDTEHIGADIDSEEEDLRITKIVQNPFETMLCIQGTERDVFVNMLKVKLSIREEVKTDEETQEVQ